MALAMIPSDLISVSEAAALSGRKIMTIRAWYYAGAIRKFRRGRREVLVSRAEVERVASVREELPDGAELRERDGPPTIELPAIRSRA